MSISTTFKSGNFNTFDTLVRETLPAKAELIRYDLIPNIDETLKKMLGANLQVEKESIDVSQLCGKEGLVGFLCTIVYNVEDFDVPDAPEKAVKQDIDALTDALSREDVHLKSINIEVSGGVLTIVYEIPITSGK